MYYKINKNKNFPNRDCTPAGTKAQNTPTHVHVYAHTPSLSLVIPQLEVSQLAFTPFHNMAQVTVLIFNESPHMIRDLMTSGLYRLTLYVCKNEEAVANNWKETICRSRAHGWISSFFFFIFTWQTLSNRAALETHRQSDQSSTILRQLVCSIN